MSKFKGNIRVKFPDESLWAAKYDDLPDNQVELNNHPLTKGYKFGDRVEIDEDRNIIRLVMTAEEVMKSTSKD